MKCLGSHESTPKWYLNLCSSLWRLSCNRRKFSVCHSHGVGFLYFHSFSWLLPTDYHPRGPHSNAITSSHEPRLLQYTTQTSSLTLTETTLKTDSFPTLASVAAYSPLYYTFPFRVGLCVKILHQTEDSLKGKLIHHSAPELFLVFDLWNILGLKAAWHAKKNSHYSLDI